MDKTNYVFGGLVVAMVVASASALVQAYQPVPDRMSSFVDTHNAGPSGEVVKDAGAIVLPEMTIAADKPTITTHKTTVKMAPSRKLVVGGVLDLHTIPNRPLRQHDPSNSFEYHSN